jgi:hypothetical protein
MDTELSVRSAHGSLPWVDHGFTMAAIKEWREAQHAKGLPNSLGDFYAAHDLCFDCEGHGVQMTGWTQPLPEEVRVAKELNVERLPLYSVCETCHGTGRAPRSEWRKTDCPERPR